MSDFYDSDGVPYGANDSKSNLETFPNNKNSSLNIIEPFEFKIQGFCGVASIACEDKYLDTVLTIGISNLNRLASNVGHDFLGYLAISAQVFIEKICEYAYCTRETMNEADHFCKDYTFNKIGAYEEDPTDENLAVLVYGKNGLHGKVFAFYCNMKITNDDGMIKQEFLDDINKLATF